MRILFVAMVDSIHTARWISQLTETDWDIHLFPSFDWGIIHPDFHDITIYLSFISNKKKYPKNIHIKAISLFFDITTKIVKDALVKYYPNYWKNHLKKIIQKTKPDIIHSLEFQSAGYLVLEVKKEMKTHFPTWIATNWGSDIYLFGRLNEHKQKIAAVLSSCDYYQCECYRDIDLAKKIGLNGKILPIVPNTGGFNLVETKKLRGDRLTSSRRLIILKGHQGWAGRCLVGLRALELCVDYLKGYTIMIFSPAPEVKIAAELFSNSTGVPIQIMPKSPHREVLKMFGQARIFIGLSISDAISTSLLEALVMGAFPIQSNTSCANEWIKDGESGFIVPPEDPDIIANAIRSAIVDDELVNKAAIVNENTAEERLNYETIRRTVIEFYYKVYQEKINMKNIGVK